METVITEGDPARPLILFVCVHNAGRSRMAEAFFNLESDASFIAASAGTEPADSPHREVVEAMAAVGLEINLGQGTLLTEELANRAKRIVGMGCDVSEACPASQTPMEEWQLDDPKGRSPEEVAAIRDEISQRVRELLRQLKT